MIFLLDTQPLARSGNLFSNKRSESTSHRHSEADSSKSQKMLINDLSK